MSDPESSTPGPTLLNRSGTDRPKPGEYVVVYRVLNGLQISAAVGIVRAVRSGPAGPELDVDVPNVRTAAALEAVASVQPCDRDGVPTLDNQKRFPCWRKAGPASR